MSSCKDGHDHKCVLEGDNEGQRVLDIDECFKPVFKTRNWKLVQVKGQVGSEAPEGPSMYHISCKHLTHVLCRSHPKCHGCNVPIPSRIQVVFSLLNFQYGDDPGYFR